MKPAAGSAAGPVEDLLETLAQCDAGETATAVSALDWFRRERGSGPGLHRHCTSFREPFARARR